MDEVVGWAAHAGEALYLLGFGLALGESALLLDLVVPGETGMVLVGAAGSRARLSLPLLILVSAVGAVAGDSIGFVMGRRWGAEVANRWSFTQRHLAPRLEQAESYVERHGGSSVFLARWVGALRAVVPVVAGASRMPYRSFVAWSAASSVLWTAVMISAGWYLGDAVAGAVDRFGWAISVIAIGGLVAWSVWHRRRRSSAADSRTDTPHGATN